MNWLKSTYKRVAHNIGKIMASGGAALLSLDLAGYGDQIKTYASQYLGADGEKKVGLILFLLLLARTAYAGWKLKQTQEALATAQAALPPVQMTPVEPQSPIKAGAGG